LLAEIELLSVQPSEVDSLAARIAPQEAFQDAKIQYSPALNAIRFSVEQRANGQPYLRLTTPQPVNEPFVDMLVELTWASGRLVREFPILLDPPGFAASKPAPAIAAPAPSKQAPAAAPAKQPKAAPATVAAGPSAGGEEYKVAQGDTLYRIASQVKPADVNLDQMVVTLFRDNRQAFMGDNMNRLKSGAILRVPSAEQANSVTATDAKREIRAQAADWNAYRNKLAGQVAGSTAQAEEGSQTAAGKIGKATAEQPAAPAATPKDVLKLSKNAEAKGDAGKAAGAEERANALQEESTARQNQIKEEKTRIAELEKNIQDMQKLLTMKNEGMAELQKKAETAKAEAAKTETAAPAAPAKATSEAQPAPEVKPAVQPATPQAEQQAPPATPAPPVADTKPAEEAKPKPVVKKPVAVAPAPETSFLDELTQNPLYQAVAAALLLLLGFFGYRKYKQRQAEAVTVSGPTSAMASDLKSGIMGGGQASGVVDTGNSSFLTDFEKTGPGVIDIEEVDPVAEAEVYIAYGRDAQAEEILKEAMAKDSGRHEIPLKLLEIYAARKSSTDFEATTKDLHQAIGSSHPLWNRVAEMGRKLDPNNPLYSTGIATAMAPVEAPLEEPPALEAPRMPAEGGPTTEELVSHGDGLDFDLHPSGMRAPSPTESAQVFGSVSDHGLDLPPTSLPVETHAKGGGALDFDLGGIDLTKSSSDRTEPPAAEQTLLVRPSSGPSREINLDLPDSPVVSHVTTHNVHSQGSFDTSHSPELELPKLSLGDDSPGTLKADGTTAKRPQDLNGGLHLDTPAVSGQPDISVQDDEGTSEWQSVATKLDLARAYLEIGDKDGAREILQEVLHEGDPQQKREAETLTATLS
jgi:pilus assembly protein FimV